MLRSIARVSALMTLVVPTTVVLVGGCGESVTVADALGSGPIFGSADAGEDAIAPTNEMDAEAVDVLMCPVMTCTFPQATCPSSASPCDVDLLSDDENCGARSAATAPTGATATAIRRTAVRRSSPT